MLCNLCLIDFKRQRQQQQRRQRRRLQGGAAAAEAEKLLSTRERNHLRMQKKFESLQQRLEQLVAVHRQVGRNWGVRDIEMERSEF